MLMKIGVETINERNYMSRPGEQDDNEKAYQEDEGEYDEEDDDLDIF